ncbi:MAG: hypothetical protein EXR51_08445 [Dehalococcoidia bacterium]|nr:hypothetical protein [Dehalococcoidia bacterium]
MTSSIDYQLTGHIATITIDRPEALNALTDAMHHELAAAYRRFQAEGEAWVGVVRGAGEQAFSVGRDLKERAELLQSVRPVPPPPVWPEIDKPLIAAVQGYALGLGFLEVLRCDFRLAAETARFSLPEVRVGMPGPVEPLVRLIPFGPALYMLLTGAQVDARQALQFGLLLAVVPPEQLEQAVHELADTLCANAPLAVRATKRNARFALTHTPEQTEAFARENNAAVIASEDFAEGARAFAEKRRPEWRGR